MSDGPSRRTYLDVLRGVAVLVMIEAHVLDSWTRLSDRQTRHFTDAIVIGGFGAPLFLFLAGVAVPLLAGSKFRRSGDVGAASRAVVRRGLNHRARIRISRSVVASRAVPGVVHVQSRHPEHHGSLDHGSRGNLGRASHRKGPVRGLRCRHAGGDALRFVRGQRVSPLVAPRSNRRADALCPVLGSVGSY